MAVAGAVAVSDADEVQAAAWRSKVRRLVAERRRDLMALRGNVAAHNEVVTDWQPLLDAIRDEHSPGGEMQR